MTIPFLSYFKRAKGTAAVKEAPPKPVVPPLEKPSSERFSKTVMPNATRTLPPQDPFEMAARSTALGGQMPSVATAVAPAVGRTISFSPNSAAIKDQRDLPPAVALALEPQVERVISIELSDVLTEMPEGYAKPIESIDTTRRVLLKASEVEKGMARGKPTVSLATVYQQVPEIFIRKIGDSDESQLPLPINKVLDAFAKLHVRGDQEQHMVVPQVETPFLKVAVEDGSEFGTPMEPLEMSPGPMPSVRVEMPTAEAFAAAEPEAAADAIVKMAPAPSTNGHRPQSPKRIPFKLSPNGTDALASESVPASSEPSVPNSLASPLSPMVGIDEPGQDSGSLQKPESSIAAPTPKPSPVRIPFKMAASPAPVLEEEPTAKADPWLTKESLAASEEASVEPA